MKVGQPVKPQGVCSGEDRREGEREGEREGWGRGGEPMLGNPAHLTCLAKPPWPAGFRVVSELA